MTRRISSSRPMDRVDFACGAPKAVKILAPYFLQRLEIYPLGFGRSLAWLPRKLDESFENVFPAEGPCF